MGFLSDGLQLGPTGMSRPSKHRRDASRSRKKHRSRSRSHSHSHSTSRTRRGTSIGDALLGSITGDAYSKHNSSRRSFFGAGNTSRSSFFNFGNRSSYYKRSPRHGFMQRAYRRLKRLIRDLVHYAKRHPWKVFFLVIMPLVTTGVLGGLLARFGLRIPPSLERLLGVASRAASGDSLGLVSDAVRMVGSRDGNERASTIVRGHDGGLQWERRSSYGSHGRGYGYSYGNSRGRNPDRGYRGYSGYSDDDWGSAVAGIAKKFI